MTFREIGVGGLVLRLEVSRFIMLKLHSISVSTWWVILVQLRVCTI